MAGKRGIASRRKRNTRTETHGGRDKKRKDSSGLNSKKGAGSMPPVRKKGALSE